jgi:hypothetical protein
MSYWITKTQNVMSTENFGLGGGSAGKTSGEFYELEPAVVLDIVLDKDHPLFKQAANLQTNIDVDRWPSDLEGKKPEIGEIDYSWIGRALVRLQFTSPVTEKEKLIWAYPIDSAISEYPLVNEVVILMKYRNKFFYSRKLNMRNLPNEAVDFSVNPTLSGQGNTELYSTKPYQGPVSKTSHDGSSGYKGVAGKYYTINDRMRRLKRYEGDTVIESRFGQSIRFGAYDDTRDNDKGDTNNADYFNGGGNPMLIIRNRQRKLLKKGETLKLVNSPNPATVTGTDEEKNAGGFVKEDINHDGSSIYITTGQTISKWVTTCYKKMLGTGEEVGSFNGNSTYNYPILNGDQIILNSNRLLLSSRYGETLHYSKKRYAIVTDNDYTLDAHQQIVLTTNTKTVINSPAIYLGEYDNANEPAILGQTLANWLYDLCNWLGEHTHWYLHSHVDAGKESPSQTQLPVQLQQLYAIRDRVHTILSRRVFITGGGFAPGKNGGDITNGTPPVKINTGTGAGIPGGWKGANKR